MSAWNTLATREVWITYCLTSVSWKQTAILAKTLMTIRTPPPHDTAPIIDCIALYNLCSHLTPTSIIFIASGLISNGDTKLVARTQLSVNHYACDSRKKTNYSREKEKVRLVNERLCMLANWSTDCGRWLVAAVKFWICCWRSICSCTQMIGRHAAEVYICFYLISLTRFCGSIVQFQTRSADCV